MKKLVHLLLTLCFLRTQIHTEGAVPPDQSTHENVVCYARNLSPGCPRGSVLAVTSFHYGFKDASLNCTSDGTAKGDCCVYDNSTDCLQEAPKQSKYVNEFSGKNEGFIFTSKAAPEKGGACESPSYSPKSVFGRLTFTCIKETRIHSVCTSVDLAVKSAKPIYIQNRNYPHGIPAKDNDCTCSVDATFRSNIEMYTVHMDLFETPKHCYQNLTVTNADGLLMKTFLCEKEFNEVKNETIPTSYFVVSLQNTLIIGDLGKFWLGFQASYDGDEIVVNCPARPPIDCGSPSLIRNGQVSSTSTRFGGTSTYVCNTGYERTTGSDVLSCMSNGSWSGSPLVCSPVDCGKPTKINNGSLSYNLTSFGYNVTYTCNNGYKMINGSDIRSCQSTGIWEGNTPMCLLIVRTSSSAVFVYVGVIVSLVVAVGTIVVVVVMYLRHKLQNGHGKPNENGGFPDAVIGRKIVKRETSARKQYSTENGEIQTETEL